MKTRRVIIIGAGPGGLTCGMILAHRGYEVILLEKLDRVGGRNRRLELGEYKFDVGPTFLMMKFILDEVFALAGKKTEDYLDAYPLDPMYRLNFDDRILDVTPDHEQLRERLAACFPGEAQNLDLFMKNEGFRFAKMKPCLQKDYSHFSALYSKEMLSALPHLSLGKSVYQNLGRYFQSEKLRTCFSFQAKYLGMSPWSCPAAFTIIPYVEHAFGIWHVRGGLSEISSAMAKAFREDGGVLHLNTPVKRVLLENGKAAGVELVNGEKMNADAVVINADFGHAMTTLFAPGQLRKYTEEKLRKREFSCSTYMLYLGVNKTYEEHHHQILFAQDYQKNIRDIAEHKRLSEDFSVYVRNAGATDPTLAPQGKSALYVLVPTPNNTANIDWPREKGRMREKTLAMIKARTSMKDIEAHIEVEQEFTPQDWAAQDVYMGATFNLAHSLGQMLYFRPHNQFEEVGNCYLVGGGTHPGSGLPTIYESGRITANIISRLHSQ